MPPMRPTDYSALQPLRPPPEGPLNRTDYDTSMARNQFHPSEHPDERHKLMTAPPTSFQNILPPSLIAPPNESTKTPRSRFAHLARKAALPTVKGVMNSLRHSKSREKPPRLDAAAAVMWAETTSTSKSSLSDTSSSKLSHEWPHDPNHTWRANLRSDAGELNPNKTTTSSNNKPGPIRTVRFKEEQEFIPTPLWTPSSSTDSVDRSNADDDYPWDDFDSRPNKALASAGIDPAPIIHDRSNPGLRIVPPLATGPHVVRGMDTTLTGRY